MPANGILCLPLFMMFYLVSLFSLVLLCSPPASADAGVAQRIAALTLLVEQHPEDQVPRLQRALAYMENNEPALALSDIQVAETLGDPVAAAYTHGVLLYRQKDYSTARPYFDRYLQAYPDDWGALDYRARLLRDIGQNRLALADYEALLRLNDNLDPGYYVATARLMADTPGRGVEAALLVLDTRIAQRGKITSLQRYAIELERGRGNYTAAIERMTTLDAKLRATPQWQLEVAELLLQAQRAEEALPYLAVAQEQLQSGRATVVQQTLLKQAEQLRQQVDSALEQAADAAPDARACSATSVDSDKTKVVDNRCDQPD
jgi:tetratricopeptide (TPR) repeat protein